MCSPGKKGVVCFFFRVSWKKDCFWTEMWQRQTVFSCEMPSFFMPRLESAKWFDAFTRPEVSIQQADCEKDLAAAIPLVEQAEVPTGWHVICWYLNHCLSMYGIFTYIYHKNQLNVGRYMLWVWDPRKGWAFVFFGLSWYVSNIIFIVLHVA